MFNEKNYLDLLASIVPKPIESEEELDRFCIILDSLEAKENKSQEEEAVFNLLTILIVDYEDKHCPIPEPEPLDYLLHLMENKEITAQDLVTAIGNRNKTQLILNNSLEIDLHTAKALGLFFNVNYKHFL